MREAVLNDDMGGLASRFRHASRHRFDGRPRDRRESLLNLRSAAGQVFLLQIAIVVHDAGLV